MASGEGNDLEMKAMTVVNTEDRINSASQFEDDVMITGAVTTQSNGNEQSTMTSIMIDDLVKVSDHADCTEDTKEMCGVNYCYKGMTINADPNSSRLSVKPSNATVRKDNQEEVDVDKRTAKDPPIQNSQSESLLLIATKRGYKESATSWPLNQKGRNLSPRLSTPHHYDVTERSKLLPTERSKLLPHPWILPFPHYSRVDYGYMNRVPFEDEQNDQGFIGTGSHGLRCQICWDGSVQCVLMPCGHARTCWYCSNHFWLCPFCRQAVDYVQIICW